MSPEWLTAAGTIGTLVVIAASAVAALVQLRHMRRSNQIAALNEVRAAMESAEFRKALDFIRTDLPPLLQNRELLERIRAERVIPLEIAPIRYLANHFEYIGLFVRSGMVDPELACELWAGIAYDSWTQLAPITATVRAAINTGIWINFEYIAALSKQYRDSGRGSTFPAGVPRLPLSAPPP
jgi:hypothetical protein